LLNFCFNNDILNTCGNVIHKYTYGENKNYNFANPVCDLDDCALLAFITFYQNYCSDKHILRGYSYFKFLHLSDTN